MYEYLSRKLTNNVKYNVYFTFDLYKSVTRNALRNYFAFLSFLRPTRTSTEIRWIE